MISSRRGEPLLAGVVAESFEALPIQSHDHASIMAQHVMALLVEFESQARPRPYLKVPKVSLDGILHRNLLYERGGSVRLLHFSDEDGGSFLARWEVERSLNLAKVERTSLAFKYTQGESKKETEFAIEPIWEPALSPRINASHRYVDDSEPISWWAQSQGQSTVMMHSRRQDKELLGHQPKRQFTEMAFELSQRLVLLERARAESLLAKDQPLSEFHKSLLESQGLSIGDFLTASKREANPMLVLVASAESYQRDMLLRRVEAAGMFLDGAIGKTDWRRLRDSIGNDTSD